MVYQSMSIKEGEVFEVKSGPFKRRKAGQEFNKENEGWGMNQNETNAENTEEEPRMFQEYLILEREGPIDQVTIHYGDMAALQLLGILSLDNYKHLSMIPPPLLAEASYVIRVFQTILKVKTQIHLQDCSAEFEEATTCKLEDLFLNVDEELPEFFNIKSDIFTLSQNGIVTLNKSYNEKELYSRKKKPSRGMKKALKPQQSNEVILLD